MWRWMPLRPRPLRALVRDCIEKHIDGEPLRGPELVEEQERETLVGRILRNLRRAAPNEECANPHECVPTAFQVARNRRNREHFDIPGYSGPMAALLDIIRNGPELLGLSRTAVLPVHRGAYRPTVNSPIPSLSQIWTAFTAVVGRPSSGYATAAA